MLKKLVGRAHSSLIFGRRAAVLGDVLGRLVDRGSVILDVGTGDGSIAAKIASKQKDTTIEGIDVLLRPETHIPVQLFDGAAIPYDDDSVDVVSFVDVLHHTENPDQLLSEAARVSRRSVVIKDHLSENRLDYLTLRLMDWVGNAPHGVVLPYNYVSRGVWLERVERAGLEVEVFETDIPLYPWPLSAVFGRSLHFVARLRKRGEK
jgi:SAM-dependent methyltransferase